MMMRIILFQIILLLLVSISPSCTQNDHSAKINTLDSLHNTVNRIEKQIAAIDEHEAKENYEEIVGKIKSFIKNYHDSLDYKTGTLLSEYKNIRKSFNDFNQCKQEFLTELEFSKKQIKNLTSDLKKGLIPPEKVQEYYLAELKSANEICFKAELLIDAVSAAFSKFEQINPEVQEFTQKALNKSADEGLKALTDSSSKGN